MPELTFYIYKGKKHKRIPIQTIHNWPTDWPHLKELINECAMTAWQEHDIYANVLMTLELHLPGHIATRTIGGIRMAQRGSYVPMKIRVRREVQWFGRVTFSPRTATSEVGQCMFGPSLKRLAPDYYEEHGVKYRVPSLILKEHQSIAGDPKALLMEPSSVRFADYSREPREIYGSQEEQAKTRHLYDSPCEEVRTYLPPALRQRELELATRKKAVE